nr:hypothetical protein [uncultured bacterium]
MLALRTVTYCTENEETPAEGADHATRVGEVFGGAPRAGSARYQAQTMNGTQVASKGWSQIRCK